jgi:hypothetical protein
MRGRGPVLLFGAAVVVIVVGVVFAIAQIHKWYKQCDEAGGRVEQRFEYASIDMTNHYDGKGQLLYVSTAITQHYSYHCWANGQEVLPSWMS